MSESERYIVPIIGPIKIEKKHIQQGIKIIVNADTGDSNQLRNYVRQFERKLFERNLPVLHGNRESFSNELITFKKGNAEQLIYSLAKEENLSVKINNHYILSEFELFSLFSNHLKFLLVSDNAITHNRIFLLNDPNYKSTIPIVSGNHNVVNKQDIPQIIVTQGFDNNFFVNSNKWSMDIYIGVYCRYMFEVTPTLDKLLEIFVNSGNDMGYLVKRLKRITVNTIEEYWKKNYGRRHAGKILDIILPDTDTRIYNYEKELERILSYYEDQDKKEGKRGIKTFIEEKVLKHNPRPPLVIVEQWKKGERRTPIYLSSLLKITPSLENIHSVIVLLRGYPSETLNQIQKITAPKPEVLMNKLETWRKIVVEKLQKIDWVHLENEFFLELIQETNLRLKGGR